ncbi:MAG: hypothetical protein ACOY31_08845 [Bacillota bacterium]
MQYISNNKAIYFQELFFLCSQLNRNCDAIFNSAGTWEKDYFSLASPELLALIVNVLGDCLKIKNIIDTPETRLENEPKITFDFRRARAEVIKKTIARDKIAEILDDKLPENLDDLNKSIDSRKNIYSEGGEKPIVYAAYKMTLSNLKMDSERVTPIRLYVANERKFYNLRYTVDIGKIYSEASLILEKIYQEGVVSDIINSVNSFKK